MKLYKKILFVLPVLPVVFFAFSASAAVPRDQFHKMNLCNQSVHAECLASGGAGNYVYGKPYKVDHQQLTNVINEYVCHGRDFVNNGCPFRIGTTWNSRFKGRTIVSIRNWWTGDCYITDTQGNDSSPLVDLALGCHHSGWLWIQVPGRTGSGYLYVNVGKTNNSNDEMEISGTGKDDPIRMAQGCFDGCGLDSIWLRFNQPPP